ncbi:kinesin-like protein KIF13A, partial [Coregonus clupeaformis]|uniref:kinesin-like protein KIF13A n=1 Tax=Coregonus clupeaformis TaxID=59861 RepID=UPI001E1C5E79
ASEEPEERETLALMAARGDGEDSQDGQTYIEQYTRGVLEVENILSLERLRQAVTVKEALSVKGRNIRRSFSTPNVQHSSCSKTDLTGCEDGDWKGDCHQDVSDCTLQDGGSLCGTPLKNKTENHGLVPESPTFFNSSPFKALSPQTPKFLKSLLPVREERKTKRVLEARPLLGQESLRSSCVDSSVLLPPPCHGHAPWRRPRAGSEGHRTPFTATLTPSTLTPSTCTSRQLSLTLPHTADSEEEADMEMALSFGMGPQHFHSFQSYIPVDFANFEVYNATLETQEGVVCVAGGRGELRGGRGGGDREVAPRSPTASSCTSGYFSHSASDATLSDVPFGASDSSDQLSASAMAQERNDSDRDTHHLHPHETPSFDSTQTRGASPWGDTQTPACPPGVPSQPLPIPQTTTSPSSPVSIPNCSEQQPSPLPRRCVLSVSQEFTDFKGADDGMGDLGELGHFQEGWQPGDAPHISSVQQEKEKEVSDKHAVVINTQQQQQHTSHPGNAPLPQNHSYLHNGKPCVSSVAIPCPPPSSPPGQLAGGEPQIQEPIQGDLPPGSPCPSPSCPSPNPSSTEASGDSSSGDEGSGSGSPVAQLPDWMAPGEQVWVGKRSGTVHYVGGVEFAKGIWVGVQLDVAVGKHNGTVQGRVYFRCPPGYGVFVKPSCLTRGPPSMDTTDPQPLVR